MSQSQKPINFEELASGVGFPAERIEVIEQAKENGASDIALSTLQALPMRRFMSMKDLNEALGKIEKMPGQTNIFPSQGTEKQSA